MQPRLTLSALSTWYMATYLLSSTYQYLKQFSFAGRNAQKSDNHECGSDSRRKGQPRMIAHQEDKPACRQEITHEPDTQQAIETTRTEGRTARQDCAPRADIGHKGSKTASHRRTPVTSKPARKAVSQNRAHMADIGHKGDEKVSQDGEHMADIGHKGGERVRTHGLETAEVRAHDLETAEVRTHGLETAEVGRKGYENTGSERKGKSRTKNRNGKQVKVKSGS